MQGGTLSNKGSSGENVAKVAFLSDETHQALGNLRHSLGCMRLGLPVIRQEGLFNFEIEWLLGVVLPALRLDRGLLCDAFRLAEDIRVLLLEAHLLITLLSLSLGKDGVPHELVLVAEVNVFLVHLGTKLPQERLDIV